jgi:hypothetical protein
LTSSRRSSWLCSGRPTPSSCRTGQADPLRAPPCPATTGRAQCGSEIRGRYRSMHSLPDAGARRFDFRSAELNPEASACGLRLLESARNGAERAVRAPCCAALHCAASRCTAPHCAAPHRAAPHRAELHRAALHCAAVTLRCSHCAAAHRAMARACHVAPTCTLLVLCSARRFRQIFVRCVAWCTLYAMLQRTALPSDDSFFVDRHAGAQRDIQPPHDGVDTSRPLTAPTPPPTQAHA